MRPQNFTKLHWTYIWHELYFSEGETSNEPRLDASGEVGHFIWRRFVGMGTCGSGSSLGGFRRTLASSKWPRVCLLRGGKFLNLHRTSGKKGWLPLLHHLTVYLWLEFFLFAECTIGFADLWLLSCNLTLTWLPEPFGDLLVASSATETGPGHQGNFVTEAVNMLCSLLLYF